jgi:hypothetical protein
LEIQVKEKGYIVRILADANLIAWEGETIKRLNAYKVLYPQVWLVDCEGLVLAKDTPPLIYDTRTTHLLKID